MEARAADFNPQQYPDVPLYNIQAVAAATGVPAITLRSWERRYGIPEPKRDPKGYRLYSERDIAVTRWLKERVQQGVGISRAVHMLRVLETGTLQPQPGHQFDLTAIRSRLMDAVMRMDEGALNRVIGEALMVASVEEVSLELLQPALYEMGERWSEGRLSVTTEHVGSNLIRSHLAQLVRLSPPPLRDDSVMVACAPGENHDIGPLMLSLFLRRRGFSVTFVGASIEADSFIHDVLQRRPSCVCLSASSSATAEALADLARRLRDVGYYGLLSFGGRIFIEQPELIASIPGDYLGDDASSGTRNLEAALLD